eukprot:COSAG05_NODE_311_length_11636_cov_11.922250_17_plen_80_part_00
MDKLLTPKRELEVVGGIVGGMTFLHEHNVCHRSVTPLSSSVLSVSAYFSGSVHASVPSCLFACSLGRPHMPSNPVLSVQ